MKKLIFTLFATMCLGGLAIGQVQTPAPSPSCVVKQTVGLTDVEINYSRPSMKDRQVFGGLVPYGEMWRTGANASTKISFSNDVRIDGKDVKAGTYALFSIPGVDNWTIILHKNTKTNGVPNPYKEEEEAVRLTVPAKKLGFNMESMLININNLRNNSATIELMWENTLVGFDVDFGTDALVQASIDRVLAGPSASDYYRAARYYKEENKDLVKALGWIRTANDSEPRYWTLLLQAQLEAELMQYEAALASAERSKELAMKDNDMNYVRRNEELIAEVKAKLGTKQKEPTKTLKNSKSESKM